MDATAVAAGNSPSPALRSLKYLTIVYVIVLAVLPLQMTLAPGALADSIMRDTPGLDPAHLDFAVATSLIYTWALHAVSAVLIVWFLIKTMRGRRWARVAMTAYLVLLTLASLTSATAGAEYVWAVAASDAIHIAMLVLLWVPRSVRAFFSAARRNRMTHHENQR